ncbi:MAG: extracellular solute-binding protein [Elusimicrobiota bacterium]|jgi:ABC-type glycerol-3-phosphate transport system substrate-binding protein|nr:extracellular solute-binding protein [Elusimicrobiota bacterium]
MILWMMPDNATRTREVMETFINPFKKENPDVSVTIRVINRRTLWRKIFTLTHEIPGDEIPDVIAMPHYWTQLLAVGGVLENLTELDKTLRVDNSLDPLKPHSYKNDSADVYSMPWWFDVSALHYREDHLKLVSKEPRRLLSTWQGLLEACGMLKEYFENVEGYFPMQNSDWRGMLSNRGVLPCLWSKGAIVISQDGKTADFNSPAFESGLQDYIDLALKRYMPILMERNSLGGIGLGKSSMIITRRQGVSVFERNSGNIILRTLSVPKTGDSYVNYLSGVNLGIIKTGAGKESALKFLKWISGVENQIKYASMAEVFPAAEESFESFMLFSPERMQTYNHIIAESASLPNLMATGTVMEVLGEVLMSVVNAIVTSRYSEDILKSELKKAALEVSNILGLYGG